MQKYDHVLFQCFPDLLPDVAFLPIHMHLS